MSNDANRTLIVLVAAAWIVVMAVLIFFTWSADTDVIDRIGDFQEYLDAHNDDAGKLIVTLGALVTVVLALLVIIVEVAPEEEEKELRVEQAGATTIVPASALRHRLEEAVAGIPQVTASKAKVTTKDKGIAVALDLTLLPEANVAATTQEASRVVIDTVQTDLGLPVMGVPTVKIAFGPGAKPAASSVPREPAAETPTAEERLETIRGRAEAAYGTAPPEEPPAPPAYSPWSPPPPEAEPAPEADQPAEEPGEPEQPQP